MRATTIVAVVLCLAVPLVGCQQRTTEEDRAGIDELRAGYAAAYNAGDLDGLMAYWAADAVWIHNGHPEATGRDAIRALYQDPPVGVAVITINPQETRVAGDFAAEWGTYTLAWADEAIGGEQMIDGRYAALDHRSADGSWKIARLNTNSERESAQAQTYPEAGAPEVVFENDRIIVQRLKMEPGSWSGEHPHAGNQLVVALDRTTMAYRAGGEEWEETLEPGTVFWVESTAAHDHMPKTPLDSLLITLK